MEYKTKVHADEGRQDLTITRDFDLPVELLFKAYTDPALFEEWMSHENGTTKVLKFENHRHGSWEFETTDADGNKRVSANGTIHEIIPEVKITRTFEMENAPFSVQLEFIEFEKLNDDMSRLKIHSIFRSGEHRDELLKLPFSYGLNMAHDRLEKLVGSLK